MCLFARRLVVAVLAPHCSELLPPARVSRFALTWALVARPPPFFTAVLWTSNFVWVWDYCFRYGALLDTAFFTFIVAIDTYRRPLRLLGAFHAC